MERIEIEIIYKVNEILDIADSIEDNSERQKFLEDNIEVFYEFKYWIASSQFQFKEKGNKKHNEIAEMLKRDILRLLDLKDFFEKYPNCKYFKSELLEDLKDREIKFLERIEYGKNMDDVEIAIEYMNDRKEYIKTIEDNNLLEEENPTFEAANNYVSEKYKVYLLLNTLYKIRRYLLEMPKEQIIDFFDRIDDSIFPEEILSKYYRGMDVKEQCLFTLYCETVLKLKSIFTPDRLKDDIVIKQMWEGKIKDPLLLESIIENLFANSFKDLLKQDRNKSQDGFISSLSKYFQDKNLPEESIILVMEKIFEDEERTYEIAEFLAQIDTPRHLLEFKDGKHSQEHPWLNDKYTFKKLKEIERKIEKAQYPFLPAEYYLQKIDKLEPDPEYIKTMETFFKDEPILDVSEHFIGNLITLINSNYYSEEDKEKLKNALIQRGLWREDTQLIPIDVAKDLLKEDLLKQSKISKEDLQKCVRSIVCNILKEKGIDIENKVFFGEDADSFIGYMDYDYDAIWIEDSVLEEFINAETLYDKTRLFEVMFHEIHHAIQFDNMRKGKIDYLTYNFIKEEVIRAYDKDFYEKNCSNMIIESDARKEQISGTLNFIKEISPELAKIIEQRMEEEFIFEDEHYSIEEDSKKKNPFVNNEKMDISEYVGYLIHENPEIFIKYPILAIEYNLDGSRKDGKELEERFGKHKVVSMEDMDMNYLATYNLDKRKTYAKFYGIMNNTKGEKSKKNNSIENDSEK